MFFDCLCEFQYQPLVFVWGDGKKHEAGEMLVVQSDHDSLALISPVMKPTKTEFEGLIKLIGGDFKVWQAVSDD